MLSLAMHSSVYPTFPPHQVRGHLGHPAGETPPHHLSVVEHSGPAVDQQHLEHQTGSPRRRMVHPVPDPAVVAVAAAVAAVAVAVVAVSNLVAAAVAVVAVVVVAAAAVVVAAAVAAAVGRERSEERGW